MSWCDLEPVQMLVFRSDNLKLIQAAKAEVDDHSIYVLGGSG